MSNFKKYVWPALSLSIICIVVAGVLAVTNHYTEGIIKQNEIDAANAAKLAVMPEADGFDVVTLTDEQMAQYNVVDVVVARNGVGTVITVASDGYKSAVPVMVGFNPDGTIAHMKVLENEETVGVGTRVEEPEYLDQYTGLSGDLSSVQNITGATFSSKAVYESVEKAFAVLELVKEAA